MNTSDTCTAVRALRLALSETQEQFARRLGKTVRTVARYETNRPPTGKMLVRLQGLASNLGMESQAALFAAALAIEMGALAPSPPQQQNPHADTRVRPDTTPRNEDEERWLSALLYALRKPEHAKRAERVKGLLGTPDREVRLRVENMQAGVEAIEAIVKLVRGGQAADQVAGRYGMPVELVELLAMAYDPGSRLVSAYGGQHVALTSLFSALVLAEGADALLDMKVPKVLLKELLQFAQLFQEQAPKHEKRNDP